jgi:hypothetical protein
VRSVTVAARPALRWWQRLLRWLRARFGRRQLPPAPSWREQVASLPEDLRAEVAALPVDSSAAVRETVTRAVADYLHLREVLLGPGASAVAVDDAVLLGEAEATLRSIVARAPAVSALVAVAVQRGGDRRGREAAGDAVLHLRDQSRGLHETASAAIEWAASRSAGDAERLRASADRMRQTTALAERAGPR